jgi:hypothetical protein
MYKKRRTRFVPVDVPVPPMPPMPPMPPIEPVPVEDVAVGFAVVFKVEVGFLDVVVGFLVVVVTFLLVVVTFLLVVVSFLLVVVAFLLVVVTFLLVVTARITSSALGAGVTCGPLRGVAIATVAKTTRRTEENCILMTRWF